MPDGALVPVRFSPSFPSSHTPYRVFHLIRIQGGTKITFCSARIRGLGLARKFSIVFPTFRGFGRDGSFFGRALTRFRSGIKEVHRSNVVPPQYIALCSKLVFNALEAWVSFISVFWFLRDINEISFVPIETAITDVVRGSFLFDTTSIFF